MFQKYDSSRILQALFKSKVKEMLSDSQISTTID